MTRLDPTTTTPCLRVRLLAREKVKVEERNNNDLVARMGRPLILVRGPSSRQHG